MRSLQYVVKERENSSRKVAMFVGASSQAPKGSRFSCCSGHTPGLWARSLVSWGMCRRQSLLLSMFPSHTDLSLSPQSLPSSPSNINKNIPRWRLKRKRERNQIINPHIQCNTSFVKPKHLQIWIWKNIYQNVNNVHCQCWRRYGGDMDSFYFLFMLSHFPSTFLNEYIFL